MASDHQVALTRSQRMPAPSTHISKAARQVVPAFLQKLYEMVNDPNNAELIRWSEAGDSFFVLDHERFAHEVLGRWFKHRNFSSFVRQLNMYGFHKIPHLQQGVLKSDTDTEFWNFAHANFHRGQPDLLCLIQRKKQIPQPGEEGAIDLRDPNATVGLLGAAVPGTGAPNTTAPQTNATLSSGQILDVHSIVNGIAAIKRHQTTISTELNELKRSNQLLWQDAMAARTKHQKQQDTINRIVKFLAGVFGHHAATAGPGGVAGGSPVSGTGHGKEADGDGLGVAPGTRRKMMLMIEDAKRDGPKKSMIEELSEIPMDADEDVYELSYPTIETPISAPSPSPSVAMSDNISVTDATNYYNKIASVTPTADSATPTLDSRDGTPTSTNPNPSQPTLEQQQQQGKQLSRAVTPSHHSPTSFEFDPRLVLNQLSPAQIQQLLASLAAQTLSDPNAGGQPNPSTINPSATTTSGPITPYLQPSFDFSCNPASQNSQPSFMPLASSDDMIPFDHYDPGSPTDARTSSVNTVGNSTLDPQQQQHEERMERQWHAAEDIDKDVNELTSSIHSLVQALGLDPSMLDGNLGGGGGIGGNTQHHEDDAMHGTTVPAPPGDGGGGTNTGLGDGSSSGADFDFDSFFNNLSSSSSSGMGVDGSGTNGMDYNDLVSTAFLDEVPTPSSSDLTASPMQSLRQVSPELNLGAAANGVGSTGSRPSTAGGAGGTGAGTGTGASNLNVKNIATNTTGVGSRKRKSDVDFESLGAALTDGPTSTTKASTAAPGKSKRRKDK